MFCSALIIVVTLFYQNIAVTETLTENKKIAIGLFLPVSGSGAEEAKDGLKGAELAVDQVNQRNGINGSFLKLTIASSNVPWTAATNDLVKMIYTEGASAIIGALDGKSAHLAEQVITRAKGQVIFVTPWATEETLTQINVPWFFRLIPDDRQQAKSLIKEIYSIRGIKQVAVWVTDTYDSQAASGSFIHHAPHDSVTKFEACKPENKLKLLEEIRAKKYGAVGLYTSPQEASEIAGEIARKGLNVLLFGNIYLNSPDFTDMPSNHAEGAVLISPGYFQGGENALKFKNEFKKLFGKTPSLLSYYYYDTVMVIAEALKKMNAGSDSLSSVMLKTSFEGTTGTIRFTKKGQRDIEPSLATLKNGNTVPVKK
jgi:ABC-type branched-subunit amino acid transport system substrate-binding protein